jgi:hypothetical protein
MPQFRKENGVVAIIAVFIMLVLAILGAVLASLQGADFESSKHLMDSTRAFYIADGGLQHGLRKLADDVNWRTTGETYTFGLGQYTLVSEDGAEGAVDVTSTGYIPSTTNPEAKRIVKATILAAAWESAISSSYLFDWSEMHANSEIRGDINAQYYDGDNDATYNEVGVDYDTPPNALPEPSSGYERNVSPVSIPDMDMDYYKQTAQAENQYISADYVYVADGSMGLQITDNSTPSTPSYEGNYDTSGTAYGVHGYFYKAPNYYTCVADGTDGLRIITVTDPSSPSLKSTEDTPGTAYGVYVKVGHNYGAGYAYVADGTAGLRIIDISNVNNPSETGYYDTNGTSYNVYVRGNYAYVADGTAGLQIIDVSTPSSPSLTATYNTAGTAYGVYVRGRYAYVADGDNGLVIVNVSTPSSPSLRATVNTSGTAYNVYLKGHYAYVADGMQGLQVVDVSNLNNSNFSPSIVGSFDTTDARDIHVSSNFAYIADNASGLKVIDISTPATPSLAGSFDTSGEASGVFVLGDKTFEGGNNYNNQRVWYITGNILIDLTSGNSNMLKSSLVAEGDIEIIGTGSLTMRAHVDISANENYPNLATEDGAIISTDRPSGGTESQRRNKRDFDGLLYSKTAIIDFNYLLGTAIMAYNIFLDGYCTLDYQDKYVGNPPSGFAGGVSIQTWEEE